MKEIAAAIITETGKLKTKKDHLLIAVDGRCGSGKSTLGAYLQQKMHGNLLHMDDFICGRNSGRLSGGKNLEEM